MQHKSPHFVFRSLRGRVGADGVFGVLRRGYLYSILDVFCCCSYEYVCFFFSFSYLPFNQRCYSEEFCVFLKIASIMILYFVCAILGAHRWSRAWQPSMTLQDFSFLFCFVYPIVSASTLPLVFCRDVFFLLSAVHISPPKGLQESRR